MKQFKYAPLAAMLAVIPQVQAQGPLDEGTIPFAYMNQPFGGSTQSQSIPSFGFGVTQSGGSASGSLNLLNPERPPLFNLEYKGEDLTAINLNGNNVLDIMSRFGYDANGEQSVADWLNSLTKEQKVALGIGVGLAVWCVADFCHSHGGSNTTTSPYT
jgi:hypothetical protein